MGGGRPGFDPSRASRSIPRRCSAQETTFCSACQRSVDQVVPVEVPPRRGVPAQEPGWVVGHHARPTCSAGDPSRAVPMSAS